MGSASINSVITDLFNAPLQAEVKNKYKISDESHPLEIK